MDNESTLTHASLAPEYPYQTLFTSFIECLDSRESENRTPKARFGVEDFQQPGTISPLTTSTPSSVLSRTESTSSVRAVSERLSLKEKSPKDVYPVPQLRSSSRNVEKRKFCIVGGGVAGLFSALILDELGIDYDLYEATSRLGGRVRTHYFSEPRDSHDYYEAGAMRFPDSPIMRRLFHVIDQLDLQKRLIKVGMSGRNEPTRHNGVSTVRSLPLKEAFQKEENFLAKASINNNIEDKRLPLNHNLLLHDIWSTFRDRIKVAVESDEDRDQKIQEAWDFLMQYDKYSVRHYLEDIEGLDELTVDWLETNTAGTSWYTTAFTENVLESLAFEWNDEFDNQTAPSWYCIDGGAEHMIQALKSRLDARKLHLNSPVSKLAFEESTLGSSSISVTLSDEAEVKHYDAVLNSTTLAALQKIDTSGLALPYETSFAIRALRYERSTKVGIKFAYPWWITERGIDQAGMGRSDQPMRLCVYPSYSLEDPLDQPSVLLASYTWGSDADRIACHVTRDSPNGEEKLRDLLIENLAQLHTLTTEDVAETEANLAKTRKMISDAYITHHAYDWNTSDETAGGAFSFFAPGQFSRLFPALVRPLADSRFHIIGEAASSHHAWLVGSLDSSIRGLHQAFERLGMFDEQKRMVEKWGTIDAMDLAAARGQIKSGQARTTE